MTGTDIIIMLLVLAGAAHGLIRGARPSLYLLIGLLCSVLAIMFLTVPVEALFIQISGLDSEAYRDAPAVAAFILEGEKIAAYSAAFIPVFLVIIVLGVFTVVNGFVKRFIASAANGAFSRLAGVLVGVFNGLVVALIFAVVLIRLPRPLAGSMFRESVLINLVSGWSDNLIPALAGGL